MLQRIKKRLDAILLALAQFGCDHHWAGIGEGYDFHHACIHCTKVGWRYSDDVPYETHLRYERDRANILLKIVRDEEHF